VPPAEPKADMDCDGFVTGADLVYYLPELEGFFRGPSGYACAGTTPCPAP